MKSHEYAKKLHELADFLLSKPEYETPGDPRVFQYFWIKDEFLDAVRALGSGRKEYDATDLNFHPTGDPTLHLSISRSKVCRKVQEEKWECEPLLSAEEEAQVGA